MCELLGVTILTEKITLALEDRLLTYIDSETVNTGATRDRVVSRILENYFKEKQEKQRLYDAWFMAEVEKGLKSAREEPLVEHKDALKRIHSTLNRIKKENAVKMV